MATAKDSVADVDVNATPDIKSVEMLSSSSSSSSVSTESSNAVSLTTTITAATARNEGKEEGSIDNDDDLLDLLVETNFLSTVRGTEGHITAA
mmetsp:Transcript_29264/g.43680  ORF Transcript_29264/g.43680 Transcript_29264/m.43680 type:complete len:93 (+) Transcript_29264:850-1128(+)